METAVMQQVIVAVQMKASMFRPLGEIKLTQYCLGRAYEVQPLTTRRNVQQKQ
jgi:hypothetical protein